MVNLDSLKDKLKRARLMSDITQKKVAEELEVKQSTVSAWEVGSTFPTLDNFVKLCELYSVSADYLLGLDHVEGAVTYKDLYLYLANLNYLQKEIGINKGDIYGESTPYSSFVVFSFNEKIIQFLDNYKQMKKLHDEGSINDSVFNLFLDFALNEIDFPITLDSEENLVKPKIDKDDLPY